MGEHLALQPYNSNYKIKNMNSVRHLLNYDNNSVSIWECGLRSCDDFESKIKNEEKNNRDYYTNIVLRKKQKKN